MEQKLYNFIRKTFNLAGTSTGFLLLVIYLAILAGISFGVFFLFGERSHLENPDGLRLSHMPLILGSFLWLTLMARLLFMGGLSKLNQNYDLSKA